MIDALSSAFGNFDRVVACGWLLQDALGLPLSSRDIAYAIGLKARTQAGRLKAQIYQKRKEPLAAARKLACKSWLKMTHSGRSC